MKYLSILPMLLITALLWGQGIDNKRMTRDIEVAENILDALLKEGSARVLRSYQVEGTYLEGYGVLFTIQNPFGGLAVAPALVWDNGRVRTGRGEVRGQVRGENGVYSFSQDSVSAMDSEKFKTLTETFITDYGQLLTALPDKEKICIKYAAGNSMSFDLMVFDVAQASEKTTIPGFTAVVPKQAVQDFRSGKIDRKAVLAKIEYNETEGVNPETDRDLILLNSIFTRLYQRDLSEGFFMRGRGRMEKIVGLGALFSYSFASNGDEGLYFGNNSNQLFKAYGWSLSEDQARARAYGSGKTLEQTQPDKVEKEEQEEQPDFQEFLKSFKSNVIEYGSTARNLKPEEVLSFELSFCKECNEEWPDKVKITAKQDLLEKYRQGKISLENAVAQLQVTTY